MTRQPPSTLPVNPLSAGRDQGPHNVTSVRSLIQAAKASRALHLTLPPGQYHLHNDKGLHDFQRLMDGRLDPRSGPYDRNAVFSCEAFDEVLIDGQGSVLVFDGLIQPFRFRHCGKATLRNMTVDWQRPGFSEGQVVAQGAGWVAVQVDAAYPVVGHEPVVSFQTYDPHRRRLAGICPFYGVEPLELVAPQVVRVRHAQCDRVKLGHRMVLRHIYNFAAAIHLEACRNVSIEDVTLHANPGPGVIAHYSQDIRFRRLRVEPRSDRIMSTNVDATHFCGCRGLIDFEDCCFEAMGDDAANVHGWYRFGQRTGDTDRIRTSLRVAANELAEPAEPEQAVASDPALTEFRAGDQVEFIDPRTLKPYATRQVAGVDVEASGGPVELRLDAAPPQRFTDGDLIANATQLAAVRFVRCTARNVRGRGILVQSRNVLVEDCTFDHCTGQGVHIDTATGWWESIGTRHVTVRRNRFMGCGYGSQRYCSAAGIVVETECEQPASGVHADLQIEDNLIDAAGDIASSHARDMLLTCCQRARVQGNTIHHCDIAVQVADADDVVIGRNDLGAGIIQFGGNAARHVGLGHAPDPPAA